MSNDVAFLAEFADGQPARSALELAAGAAELAGSGGGAAVALALRAGRATDAAQLGAAGASRAVVLGDGGGARHHPRRRGRRRRSGAASRSRAPRAGDRRTGGTWRPRWSGCWGCRPSARCAPCASRRARLSAEQATLQGSVITVSEPADGAPQPAVVLVLANTFTPVEGGSGTAEVERRSSDRGGRLRRGPHRRVAPGRGRRRQPGGGDRDRGRRAWRRQRGWLRAAAGAGQPRWVAPSAPAARRPTRAGCPTSCRSGRPGKVVKPALYMGIGISGAIQHRVGMQTAENVVAINKDPDAPIGEFADLFVVGDLFAIVPKLTEEIKRRKGK